VRLKKQVVIDLPAISPSGSKGWLFKERRREENDDA